MAPFLRRTERPIYDLFDELAEIQVKSADLHSRAFSHGQRERARVADRLHENATVAEELCQRVSQRLGQSLVSPHDAEMLYDLALTIADTLDDLEHTVALLALPGIGAPPAALLDVAELIERAAELTVAATWSLRRVQDLGDYYLQVRKLTRQGDRLVRSALAELYRRGGAATELLPLHDVTQAMSRTLAHQERTARVADLLRVKDS